MERTICLDMDGVLVNFFGGLCRLLDRDYEECLRLLAPKDYWFESVFGMTQGDTQGTIDRAGERFWAGLEPYPHARELYERLKDLGEVCFASSSTLNPGCVAGKVRWLQSFLPHPASYDYHLTPKKYRLAGPGRLLIDDSPAVCEAFRAAGGQAVLFPQRWNERHEEYDLGLSVSSTLLEVERWFRTGQAALSVPIV